jgi:unsaturated pyranuronate lyase
MEAIAYTWSEIEADFPVPHLTRQKVVGDEMLVAKIHLAKGCIVKSHRHVSEQMSIVLTGRVLWSLGEEGTPGHRELIVEGGQVLRIPGNSYHGVKETIEDAEVIDILSPVGPMGVDSQRV